MAAAHVLGYSVAPAVLRRQWQPQDVGGGTGSPEGPEQSQNAGQPITCLSVAAEKCLSGANGVSIRKQRKKV